jgi:hypothetical protein
VLPGTSGLTVVLLLFVACIAGLLAQTPRGFGRPAVGLSWQPTAVVMGPDNCNVATTCVLLVMAAPALYHHVAGTAGHLLLPAVSYMLLGRAATGSVCLALHP